MKEERFPPVMFIVGAGKEVDFLWTCSYLSGHWHWTLVLNTRA